MHLREGPWPGTRGGGRGALVALVSIPLGGRGSAAGVPRARGRDPTPPRPRRDARSWSVHRHARQDGATPRSGAAAPRARVRVRPCLRMRGASAGLEKAFSWKKRPSPVTPRIGGNATAQHGRASGAVTRSPESASRWHASPLALGGLQTLRVAALLERVAQAQPPGRTAQEVASEGDRGGGCMRLHAWLRQGIGLRTGPGPRGRALTAAGALCWAASCSKCSGTLLCRPSKRTPTTTSRA